MILVDYSSIAYSCLFAQMGFDQVPTQDLIRHATLNSLRRFRVQFREEYGEMILAMDDSNSWRRDIYPHYKAKRRQAREKDDSMDWNHIFGVMNQIQSELKSTFPYKVVKAPKAEGDDVIAVLSQTLPGKHIIVSKDHDMIQLMKNPSVAVFVPVKEEIAPRPNDLDAEMTRFILSGDSGDGVPNVLSDDDTFITEGKRQKPLRKTFIDAIISGEKELTPEQKVNFERNRKLVSLFEIPDEIKDAIMESYHTAPENGRDGLYEYFKKYQLKELMLRAEDF